MTHPHFENSQRPMIRLALQQAPMGATLFSVLSVLSLSGNAAAQEATPAPAWFQEVVLTSSLKGRPVILKTIREACAPRVR